MPLRELDTERQDFVDNEIIDLISTLARGKKVPYYDEDDKLYQLICEMREQIGEYYEKAGIMTDKEFYDYYDDEDEDDPDQ